MLLGASSPVAAPFRRTATHRSALNPALHPNSEIVPGPRFLAQRFDEALAIRIIHEDQFAPVTAIHDVINRTSLLDSQLASRDGGVALAALCINIKN